MANPVASRDADEAQIRELEAAIGRVTAAIAKTDDESVVVELVVERREMRAELQHLRDVSGPSSVVRLPGPRGRGGPVVTPEERDEVLVHARAVAVVADDVAERTADLSAPSPRNVIADVHELAGAVARLARAVETLARRETPRQHLAERAHPRRLEAACFIHLRDQVPTLLHHPAHARSGVVEQEVEGVNLDLRLMGHLLAATVRCRIDVPTPSDQDEPLGPKARRFAACPKLWRLDLPVGACDLSRK